MRKERRWPNRSRLDEFDHEIIARITMLEAHISALVSIQIGLWLETGRQDLEAYRGAFRKKRMLRSR
jgi:hypothetical protein